MSFLSKQLSLYLKGIAIFLMVMHHSLSGIDWYVNGVSNTYLYPYSAVIGRFAGFAVVPMFLFLTGWTYYFHKDKTMKYSLKKLTVFLLDYWLVLFGFVALAYYFCDYKINIFRILQEMFSIHNDIMFFCWYVLLYIEVMLFLPYFDKYIAYRTPKKTILIIITMLAAVKMFSFLLSYWTGKESFMYTVVNRNFYRNIPIVISGYLCAKYDVLGKIGIILRDWTVVKKYFLIAVLLFFYNFARIILTINTGLFLCPIFIAILISLDINYNSLISKTILTLGRYSMNTWFLHTLFFSEVTRQTFQKYGFWLGDPILSFLWILTISTCVSIPITKLQRYLNKKIENTITLFN